MLSLYAVALILAGAFCLTWEIAKLCERLKS